MIFEKSTKYKQLISQKLFMKQFPFLKKELNYYYSMGRPLLIKRSDTFNH